MKHKNSTRGLAADAVSVVKIYGFISNITLEGYEKKYFLEITDELKTVLNDCTEYDRQYFTETLSAQIEAYVGGKVEIVNGVEDFSDMELMYEIDGYVMNLNGEEGCLTTTTKVMATDVFETLFDRCRDMTPYVPWDINIELPIERVDAITEAIGTNIEVIGEGDNSLISKICAKYGQ